MKRSFPVENSVEPAKKIAKKIIYVSSDSSDETTASEITLSSDSTGYTSDSDDSLFVWVKDRFIFFSSYYFQSRFLILRSHVALSHHLAYWRHPTTVVSLRHQYGTKI